MRLAELRDDDVIYAGTHAFSDAFGMMEKVSEATSRLLGHLRGCPPRRRRGQVSGRWRRDEDEEDDGDDYDDDMALDDLVYGSMGEADLLSELTSLLGRMRYAVDGGDQTTAEESRSKIRAIGRYLPANRQVADLIAAASHQATSLRSWRNCIWNERIASTARTTCG